MTVAELIEKLKEFPQDASVWVFDGDHNNQLAADEVGLVAMDDDGDVWLGHESILGSPASRLNPSLIFQLSEAEPLVCCVCITRNRPELLARAMRSFEAQTYARKCMLIWDTSDPTSEPLARGPISHVLACRGHVWETRNEANAYTRAPIIAHWEDDCWSHPNRLEEQVALLQASGADCVGYNDMLFWQNAHAIPWRIVRCACGSSYPRSGSPCPNCRQYPDGEAWLCLGTQKALSSSLCYWRRTWEAMPFPDQSTGFPIGGDNAWMSRLKLATESSCIMKDPRMIALIDAESYKLDDSETWRRVTDWDDHCREALKTKESA